MESLSPPLSLLLLAQDVTVEDGLGAVWLRTLAPVAGKLSLVGASTCPTVGTNNTSLMAHIPTFPTSATASANITTVQG